MKKLAILSVVALIRFLSLDTLVGQEVSASGGILLPQVNSQGEVTSVSGFVFDNNGEKASFKLDLGFEAFGVRFAESSRAVAPPLVNLLNHPSIKKELELTEKQNAALSKLRKESRAELQEEARKIPLGPATEESIRQMTSKLGKISANQDELLMEFLLPHQYERLKQISFQALEKGYGLVAVLRTPRIMEELDISNHQMSSLEEEAKRIEKKLAEDIETLKSKAREEMLDLLKPTQRAKYEKLHGDSFSSKQSDWGEPRDK